MRAIHKPLVAISLLLASSPGFAESTVTPSEFLEECREQGNSPNNCFDQLTAAERVQALFNRQKPPERARGDWTIPRPTRPIPIASQLMSACANALRPRLYPEEAFKEPGLFERCIRHLKEAENPPAEAAAPEPAPKPQPAPPPEPKIIAALPPAPMQAPSAAPVAPPAPVAPAPVAASPPLVVAAAGPISVAEASVPGAVVMGAIGIGFWIVAAIVLLLVVYGAIRLAWRLRWWAGGMALYGVARSIQFFVVRSDKFAKSLKYPTFNTTLKRGVFKLVEQLYYLDDIVPYPKRPKVLQSLEIHKEMCLLLWSPVQWMVTSNDTQVFYRSLSDKIMERLVSIYPVDTGTTMTVPLASLTDPTVLQDIIDLTLKSELYAQQVKRIYHGNQAAISRTVLGAYRFNRNERLHISEIVEHNLDPREFVKKTPFEDFFNIQVPYTIDSKIRDEHAVILSPPGGGKTTITEGFLLSDIDQLKPPGIFHIDKKGKVARKFSKLVEFKGHLRDKLKILDQQDVPPFAIMRANSEQELIEQTKFFFSALVQSEVTGPQEGILDGLMRLMWHIPDANLATLRDALRDIRQFEDHILALPDEQLRKYLLYDFETSAKQTREALGRRLDQILNDPMLSKVFGGSTKCLDFAEALRESWIVLVVPRGKNGPIFAKYILSEIIRAGLPRAAMDWEKLNEVHIYCDEAKEYVSPETIDLFELMRESRIGSMFMFQSSSQMGTLLKPVLDSTAIKIGSGFDAGVLAERMGNTKKKFVISHKPPPKLIARPQYIEMACYAQGDERGVGDTARTLRVATGQLDRRPKMSPEANDELIKDNYRWLHRHTPASVGEPTDTYTPQPESGRLGKKANRAARRLLLRKDEGSADASPTP